MLKQTIEYTDFDDNRCVETLYFNLTKSELMDHLHLEKEFEELGEKMSGDKRRLEKDEVLKVLDLVKLFMRISYGVRSEDGKRFSKNPERWIEFTETAVYDAFLISLFEDPEKAIAFISGVIPKDLREQAMAQVEADKGKNAAMQAIRAQADKVEAGQTITIDSTNAKSAEPVVDDAPPLMGSNIKPVPSAADIEAYLASKAAGEMTQANHLQ